MARSRDRVIGDLAKEYGRDLVGSAGAAMKIDFLC